MYDWSNITKCFLDSVSLIVIKYLFCISLMLGVVFCNSVSSCNPLEKAMASHSSTLAWKIPWTKSLVGYSPWGHEESDTTERPHFHFSFSCIGEENGNPLQCSCLENPRDGGAWWTVIYGVAQSWTRLRRLSSSSSSCNPQWDIYYFKFSLCWKSFAIYNISHKFLIKEGYTWQM